MLAKSTFRSQGAAASPCGAGVSFVGAVEQADRAVASSAMRMIIVLRWFAGGEFQVDPLAAHRQI
jgi:hypothetical protein